MLIFHWFYNGLAAQLPRHVRQQPSGPEPWRGVWGRHKSLPPTPLHGSGSLSCWRLPWPPGDVGRQTCVNPAKNQHFRSWPLLGCSWPLLGRSWAPLGRSCPLLAALGPLLGTLGPLLGRSWPLLGCSWPFLGCSWPLLGRSWSLLVRSWPLLATLGRSWGALGRSWGGLGAPRVL